MSQKVDKNNFKFRKREGETLVKLPGEIDGKDFLISNCTDCEIYLYDFYEQVYVNHSKNCKVFIGPTTGSIFMRNCEDVELHSASFQLRISDSTNIKASIFAGSDPALENVKNLKIAPYNFIFPGVSEFFKKANLKPQEDFWSQVFDFTPQKEKSDVKNWEIMNPEEYDGQIIKELDGFDGDLENPIPIPRCYGGNAEDNFIVGSRDPACQQDANGMMTFNIQNSHQFAQQQADQQDQQQDEEQPQQQEFVQQEQQDQQQQNDWSQNENFSTNNINNQNNNDEDDDFYNNNNNNDNSNNYNNNNEIDSNNNDFQNQQQQQQNQFQNYGQQQQMSQEDQERQERQNKLREREQQITERIRVIQNEEYAGKQQRKQEARAWLEQWQRQRLEHIQKNGQMLRDNEQSFVQQRQQDSQNQASWKKVTSNIALKQSDYPGITDVEVMKRSLLNKRKDEEKLLQNK